MQLHIIILMYSIQSVLTNVLKTLTIWTYQLHLVFKTFYKSVVLKSSENVNLNNLYAVQQAQEFFFNIPDTIFESVLLAVKSAYPTEIRIVLRNNSVCNSTGSWAICLQRLQICLEVGSTDPLIWTVSQQSYFHANLSGLSHTIIFGYQYFRTE